jgi:hypothetical protein
MQDIYCLSALKVSAGTGTGFRVQAGCRKVREGELPYHIPHHPPDVPLRHLLFDQTVIKRR